MYLPKHSREYQMFQRVNNVVACSVYVIVAIVVMFVGMIHVGRAIANPKLNEGIATKKYISYGSPWYAEWRFGDYGIVRHHDNDGVQYLVNVQYGSHDDWWYVDEQTYESIEIGQYVKK